MKVKFGKVGIICLALVLALGILGVGFAAWSDTLYIHGSVETGHVDVEFVPPPGGGDLSSDPQGANDTTLALDGGFLNLRIEQQDKDVGTTEVEIHDSNKAATVNITNGYPC